MLIKIIFSYCLVINAYYLIKVISNYLAIIVISK